MANRISTYTMTSRDGGSQDGEPKRNLWTSMLESVASGKRLPEKNLLVMGMEAPSSWKIAPAFRW